MWGEYTNRSDFGDHRGALPIAEMSSTIGRINNNTPHQLIGDVLAGLSLSLLGDHTGARRKIEPILIQSPPTFQRPIRAYKVSARSALSSILWIQGFPDQASRSAQVTLDDIGSPGHR